MCCLTYLLYLLVCHVIQATGITRMYQKRPIYVSKETYLCMFQVMTGDSWATGVTRPLFEGRTNVVWISFFMITYILIAGIVLTNIVVAVLLDEFVTSVTNEKEALEKQVQLLKEEAHMAHRITGVLDPYTETLAQFNGTNDLTAKLKEGYTLLDQDGSGGLSFEEFKTALPFLKTKVPISLLVDDFEILTDGGKLTNEEGEFDAQQFQKIMHGELHRYTQRAVQNSMSETNSKEDRAILLGMKMLDLTQEEHGRMLEVIMSKLSESHRQEQATVQEDPLHP